MEKSALVYIGLIVITTGLALLVQNEEYISFQRFGSIGTGYRPMDRRQARNIVVMWGIYLLLAGGSACRIAVGNDYWVYRENFKLIAQERHVSSEIGFNLVVKGLVRIFGYDNYLPVFGFFSLVTVLFFVLALRDQGCHFAFSLFLLLTEGFYFNSLNTVRYYLALSMALFSMIYVLRREYGKFLLVILAGALFHKSILLAIPVYLAADFLARLKWKRAYGIAAAVLGGVFVSSLFWGKGMYRWIIFRIYPFYENSHFDQSRISYKNLAIVLGTLALCFVTWLVRRRSGAPGQEISKDQRSGMCSEILRNIECVWADRILLRRLCPGGDQNRILYDGFPGVFDPGVIKCHRPEAVEKGLLCGVSDCFCITFCAASEADVPGGCEAFALSKLDLSVISGIDL